MKLIILLLSVLIFLFVLFRIRDFIFRYFTINYLIYVNVSPTIVSYRFESNDNVLIVQLLFLFFFYLPLLMIRLVRLKFIDYLFMGVPRFKTFHGFNYIILLTALIPILYVFISFKYGVIYRRIGLGLVDVLGSMSLLEKLVYKVFDWYSFFFIGALNLVYSYFKRFLILLSLVIWIFVSVIIFFINSKLNLIVILVLLAFTTKRKLFKELSFKLFLLLLVVGISLKATNDIRYSFIVQGGQVIFDEKDFISRLLIMNPSDRHENEDVFIRTNGVVLAADFYEKIGILNFDLDYLSHIYKMSFSNDESYKLEAKKSGFTAGKIFLQRKYFNEDSPDNYSCLLTDVFGAFGVLGLLVLSIFVGVSLKLIKVLWASSLLSDKLLSIFLFSIIAFFESDYLTNISKFLFFIIPVVFFVSVIPSKESE